MKRALAFLLLTAAAFGCQHVDRYFHGEPETAAEAAERRMQAPGPPIVAVTNAPTTAKRPGERWYPLGYSEDPHKVIVIPRLAPPELQ